MIVSPGYPFADFLPGYPGSDAARSLAKAESYQLGQFLNAYAQDDWHVTSRLSVNIGLRWERHRMPVDKRDTMAAFVPLPGKPMFTPRNGALIVSGDKNADYACSHPLNPSDAGLIACADKGKLLDLTGARVVRSSNRTGSTGLQGSASPGVPTGSDRFIIRTGYGLFFDLGNFNNLHFVFNNPVFAPNQRSFAPTGQPPLFDLTNVFVARLARHRR